LSSSFVGWLVGRRSVDGWTSRSARNEIEEDGA
jgi:hypothetical protein